MSDADLEMAELHRIGACEAGRSPPRRLLHQRTTADARR
jgi:hypothetical protein